MKKATLLVIMFMIATAFSNAFAGENTPETSNNLVIEQVKPGYNGITLRFNCPEEQTVYLNLVDAQGKVVVTKEINAAKGLNTEVIDIDVQALNFLVIMLNNSTEQASKRLISNGEYAIVN